MSNQVYQNPSTQQTYLQQRQFNIYVNPSPFQTIAVSTTAKINFNQNYEATDTINYVKDGTGGFNIVNAGIYSIGVLAATNTAGNLPQYWELQLLDTSVVQGNIYLGKTSCYEITNVVPNQPARSLSWTGPLGPGDNISVFIQNYDGTNTVTLIACSVSISRIY